MKKMLVAIAITFLLTFVMTYSAVSSGVLPSLFSQPKGEVVKVLSYTFTSEPYIQFGFKMVSFKVDGVLENLSNIRGEVKLSGVLVDSMGRQVGSSYYKTVYLEPQGKTVFSIREFHGDALLDAVDVRLSVVSWSPLR